METVAPFGYWPSPLSAEQAAAGKVSLSEISSDGTSVFWLESRPRDGGRVVLVRADAERAEDHSPPGVNIRSRVHEYGGGAWCLVPPLGAGGYAYVDAADQRVWLHRGGDEPPGALTPEPPTGERWAHGGLGASADGAWVVAVREVHDATPHPRRCLVALGTRRDNAGASVLARGHDFYGAPRLDAMAERLAVVVWDHPDMPWDQSAVVVIPLAPSVDASAGPSRLVAFGEPWTVEGGAGISVGQPAWQHDGSLGFISDRHGWWQPYVHSGRPDDLAPVALSEEAAEFHDPDWALGQSTMAELADGALVARMSSEGRDSVVCLKQPDRTPHTLAQPCVVVSSLCAHQDGIAYRRVSTFLRRFLHRFSESGPPLRVY
jgi:hypothetical protein